MSITIHEHVEQRSEEWYELRAGIVTASVVGKLLSVGAPDAIESECPECSASPGEPCVALRGGKPIKTLHGGRLERAATRPPVIRQATGDTARNVTLSLIAERITGRVEPTATTSAMWRGVIEEPLARAMYAEHHAPVREVGLVTLDADWGTLGYSPDGLVGEDGLIEIKSRNQKRQVESVLDVDAAIAEHMPQMQAGLLATGRAWCDLVGYSSGMAMGPIRVYPDAAWQAAIVAAVKRYEATAAELSDTYFERVKGLPVAPRTPDYDEIEV